MAGRNYERLPVEDFGRQLITSGDLDPVYIALHNCPMGPRQRSRWLVAYWCFYHVGAACYISQSESEAFWGHMMDAAKNTEECLAPNGHRWPRGSERRHFRGEAAIKAVKRMSIDYQSHPEEMVSYIAKSAPNYEEVAKRAQEHPLFGPWISFKVADMLDRCMKTHVDFTEAAVFMFKDPAKAAEMVFRDKLNLDENAKIKDRASVIRDVVSYLRGTFSDLKAPPYYDRPVDLQEVETVLCKWKSHMNGHYPLFNDIDEINEGLAEWAGTCDTVEKFAEAMPQRS